MITGIVCHQCDLEPRTYTSSPVYQAQSRPRGLKVALGRGEK
jgi:hypothetical protein